MVTVSNRQSADLMDCILLFSRRVVIIAGYGKHATENEKLFPSF